MQLLHGFFGRQVVLRSFERLVQQALGCHQMRAQAHEALNDQRQGQHRANQQGPNRPTSRLYDGEQSLHSKEFSGLDYGSATHPHHLWITLGIRRVTQPQIPHELGE